MSKLLILAGGMSSRMKAEPENLLLNEELKQQANNGPKGMIGVGNNGRPLMDYQLWIAFKAGYEEVILLINENDKVTKLYYETKSGTEAVWGLEIKFAIQYIPTERQKPLGTADAVMQALQQHPEWQGHRFTVCNSDNLYSENALKLLANTKAPAALIAYNSAGLGIPKDKIQTYAILFFDDNYLKEIIEKPNNEQMQTCLDIMGSISVSMNIFSFGYDFALKYCLSEPLHATRNEKELPMAVQRMAMDSIENVAVYELSEFMPDLTSKADISFVQKYLKDTYTEL